MDVFLSVLPSHYMVSDEAVARFKESHRIAWLNEQLSLGDSASAQSPIFKAAAGPMPTEMELATKAQDDSAQEDEKDASGSNVVAEGQSSAAEVAEPADAAAGSAATPATAAVDQEKQKDDDNSGVKRVVESMVSTTAATETMPSPANPATAAEDSNGALAPPDLADFAPTTSTTADNPIDVGEPVRPRVADVSYSALENASGAKRSREEGDEAGGNDGEEEGAAKRMREERASSGGDAGIHMG
eukprot:COSAG02_NODE_5171_length_4573_cov_4.774475_3_plen_244_part_00